MTTTSATTAGDLSVHVRTAPAEVGLVHRWLWRRYARVYDALLGLAGYREMLDVVLAATGSVRDLAVVEVGCGTGNLLDRLLRDEPAHLLGIDASAAMLGQARTKLDDAVTAGRLRLHRGDAATQLSRLPAASVDVLIASNVLYALPDRAAFWTQAARVLRRGGRVVVSNPDRSGFGPAVRQQWRVHGVRGFTDPRLLDVVLLNVVIDALAMARRYEFAGWDALAAEAATVGLVGPVGLVERESGPQVARCYGGPDEGMNVVGVLTRR